MRRKRKLDMRIERCAHLLVSEPEVLRGTWRSVFGFEEIYVELGCGKGLFTTETAEQIPGVLLVALEKTANVLVIALERTESAAIKNVRFLNRFADDLTAFFTPGEVSRLFINFCDPWPANRHKKRRLTGFPFLELYKQVLQPEGEIHFKTDNLQLFEFSLNEFIRSGFSLSRVTYDLHGEREVGVKTDYEIKFLEQGMPIYMCIAANKCLLPADQRKDFSTV